MWLASAQAQLRAFIPLMLKYSTGRGKPGWGKDTTKPPWWPKHVPWANVRMDARTDEEKSRVRESYVNLTILQNSNVMKDAVSSFSGVSIGPKIIVPPPLAPSKVTGTYIFFLLRYADIPFSHITFSWF
jgi:hypothetical protein